MPRTTSPTHRRLLVVVAILAVAAVGGMVALWPDAERLPEAPEELEDLLLGEIVAYEPYDVDTGSGDGGGGEGEGVDDGLEDDGFGEGVDEGFEDDLAPFQGSGRRADIEVELLEGPDAGELVLLQDLPLDGYPDLAVGDRVLLDRTTGPDGDVQYFITDFQRSPALWLLLGLFVLAVLAIGRWHGLRSLLGLGLSLVIIVAFVVPAILAGQSPPLVALVGAVAVMIVTLYLAHGVNEMTTAAIIGTTGALVLTVGLGLWFISQSRITGYASDDALFASFAVQGLDLQGLVLAGLIIAALGVLDDVTVSQASTVFALHDTDRNLGWAALFGRAMRVGRDHIASVVNTLFLAYAGASLALLVLFSTGGVSTGEILNSEIIAEEIVKIIVGSLGLIAAVPLTTALAAKVAVDREPGAPPLGDRHGHAMVAADPDQAANNEAATAEASTEPSGDSQRFDPDEITLGMDRFEEQLERGETPRSRPADRDASPPGPTQDGANGDGRDGDEERPGGEVS